MALKTGRIIPMIIFIALLFAAFSFAQEAANEQNPIVREGVIDLKAIDENNDGKVFQDQMDWNVISDNPGKCPLCGMTLKEVTLEKAKENLINNGFDVK
jgi:Cu(I)/Ag(I) efflux system membrane fusion protein/cobalt-zinc-cadmium efflux system membrane fusion protein